MGITTFLTLYFTLKKDITNFFDTVSETMLINHHYYMNLSIFSSISSSVSKSNQRVKHQWISMYGYIALSVYTIDYTLICLENMCSVSSSLRRHEHAHRLGLLIDDLTMNTFFLDQCINIDHSWAITVTLSEHIHCWDKIWSSCNMFWATDEYKIKVVR